MVVAVGEAAAALGVSLGEPLLLFVHTYLAKTTLSHNTKLLVNKYIHTQIYI